MKPEWGAAFDLLTSFTALHWVPDQTEVLRNIHFCLKSSGFALLLIPVKAPHAFMQSGGLMKERWSDYLKDFVPKWRHTPGWERFNEWRRPDPADGYRRLATNVGFHVLLSKVEPFHYLFPDEERLGGMIETLTPYLPCIPDDKRAEFIKEFAREYRKSHSRTETRPEEEQSLLWDAECLVVIMRKTS